MPDSKVSFTEQLVFNAEKLSAFDHKMAAACKTHRITARRTIKRLGDWSSPVHDNGFTIFIRDRESTDMKTLDAVIFNAVYAPKNQRRVPQIELT